MADRTAAMEAAAMEAAARALFDVDPMFVGGNDWLTWDMLTDEGKARYRRRAQVAIGTYLQSTRSTPQAGWDESG
jgi:hypothetical protein